MVFWKKVLFGMFPVLAIFGCAQQQQQNTSLHVVLIQLLTSPADFIQQQEKVTHSLAGTKTVKR